MQWRPTLLAGLIFCLAMPLVFAAGTLPGTGRAEGVTGASSQLVQNGAEESLPVASELDEGAYLVLNTTDIDSSILLALDNLEITYLRITTDNWSSRDLSRYSNIIIAMDGGTPSFEDVRAVVDFCAAGGRVMFFGGSNTDAWYDGFSGFVGHSEQRGWAVPSNPSFSLVDSQNPLADELPETYSFANSAAGFYCVEVNDPEAYVAAVNGDGFPCLLKKKVGFGIFLQFANSAFSGYWTNPADFAILERILLNMIDYPDPILALSIYPDNPPVVVPPGGARINYTIDIENGSNYEIQFDAWTEAILPDGDVYGPLFQALDVIIQPGSHYVRDDMHQRVPGWASPGQYIFVAKLGDYDEDVILARDQFEFFKESGSPILIEGDDWYASDWFADPEEDEEENALFALPGELVLEDAYPNPFNSITSVTVGLPEASRISVTVYNTLGQEVASLADGRFNAGYHSFMFDARGLPSGLYFVRAATPTGADRMRKVILVK